ncbi:MAG: hypothetical protein CMH58_09090 [Myxococcales bacterium]|jgi:4-amino-4-deoxy-L-arabinose transferase-like glycosyltransferase|nr:hypothetical protein [Myxococcales bacterium]
MISLDSFDRRLAWCLGIGTFILFFLGADSVGFTRDEGYYFKAARDYGRWFDLLFSQPSMAFSQASIDSNWSYNPEHPVLMKSLFALSDLFFHRSLGWLDGPTAMRLPGMGMAALAVALTYLLGRQMFTREVGLLAALMLLFSPRFHYHGHMACFDSAVTAVWVAVILAYVNRGESIWGHVRLGLVFGLAIATKHNALFLPIVFGIHWLFCQRDRFILAHGKLRLPPIPWWVVSMGILGPLVFLMHWPYLWPEPLERITWYLSFHLHHEHYPVRYFGEGLWDPPFPRSFPWVMWAITLPLVTVVAAIAGTLTQAWSCFQALWNGVWDRKEHAFLLLLTALFPAFLIAGPKVPIFGGTKHWMNGLPILLIIAAAWAWPAILKLAGNRRYLTGVVSAFVLLPGAVTTWRHHPHGIGSYSELAGGIRGAANLGMERQFWGGASRQLLDKLNKEAKPNARLFLDRTNLDAFKAYQETGLLRADLRFARGPSRADWGISFHQPDSDWVISYLRQSRFKPVAAVEVEGVPMASLFKKEP